MDTEEVFPGRQALHAGCYHKGSLSHFVYMPNDHAEQPALFWEDRHLTTSLQVVLVGGGGIGMLSDPDLDCIGRMIRSYQPRCEAIARLYWQV